MTLAFSLSPILSFLVVDAEMRSRGSIRVERYHKSSGSVTLNLTVAFLLSWLMMCMRGGEEGSIINV